MLLGRDSLGSTALGAAEYGAPDTPIPLPPGIGDIQILVSAVVSVALTLPPGIGSFAVLGDAATLPMPVLACPPAIGGMAIRAEALPPWGAHFPSGRLVFECTLSGALSGLADAVLPLSSFQVRHRADGSSYFQAVVPTVALSDAITARRTGALTITALSGGVASEVLSGDISDVSVAVGGLNQSVTLQGNYTRPAAPAQTLVAVDIIAYQVYEGGRLSLRAAPQPSVRPGDRLYRGGQFWTVAEVVWSVSASTGSLQAPMDITAAAG